MTSEAQLTEAPAATPRGKRTPVPKAVRFEVFKRDSFTCQYCGAKAPDVVLHVDHIEAVASGGTNDVLNLLTACDACNLGKSDKPLSDNSAIERQRTQLAQLQERREQIAMMVEWRRELLSLKDEVATEASEYWSRVSGGFVLTPTGEQTVRGWLRTYSIDEVLQAMELAVEKHLQCSEPTPTLEAVEAAWNAIAGILRVCRLKETDPAAARLLYIRGIMRKRYHYCPPDLALQKLEDGLEAGVPLDQLEKLAKRARNWTTWEQMLAELIEHQVTARAGPPAAPVPRVLLEQLRYLDETRLDQLVGYAKGLAIVGATLAAVETDDEEEAEQLRSDPPPPHSATLESHPQAFGFGDALGLVRSSQRVESLIDFGEIGQDKVWDLVTNSVPWLPVTPTLRFDEAGTLKEICHPLPTPD